MHRQSQRRHTTPRRTHKLESAIAEQLESLEETNDAHDRNEEADWGHADKEGWGVEGLEGDQQ